jgi:hypothetical protein
MSNRYSDENPAIKRERQALRVLAHANGYTFHMTRWRNTPATYVLQATLYCPYDVGGTQHHFDELSEIRHFLSDEVEAELVDA